VLDRTLLHRKPAGNREQVHEVGRFVDDLGIIFLREELETLASYIGPEGDKREIVFDDWIVRHLCDRRSGD
jgi:hypothetical protein